MARRVNTGSGSRRETGSPAEQLEVAYRLRDFFPLFLRRQFEKTAFWLLGTLLATATGVTAIYAVSLVLSGQAGQLSRIAAWLLTPPLLLAVFAGFTFYIVQSNARVLFTFYRQGGGRVGVRISDDGVEVRDGHGVAHVGWGEATRFVVRRSGFVIWKGSAVPVVLPARCMGGGQYARILALASTALARLRAEAEAADTAARTAAAAEAPAPIPGVPGGVAAGSGIVGAPDYAESEYRFGEDWVPGGIRFTMSVTAKDREGLMEYSLARPGSRRGMLALGVAAAGMAVWLLVSYLSGDRQTQAINLVLAVLSAALAFLFLTAVVRPVLFMSIVQRLPGNRRKRNSAVRDVLCVFSDGVMYAKTEGRVDKVPVGAFHEMIVYREWMFLFKDRKTAYILPLRFMDDETRGKVSDALGDGLVYFGKRKK